MNDDIEKEAPPPTGKSATERKPDRKLDPQGALNELRQKVVVALLSLGFSRRTAARHVGVSHTSIARAAARDGRFAKELSDAESVADYSVLKTVRDAGRQEKYWRRRLALGTPPAGRIRPPHAAQFQRRPSHGPACGGIFRRAAGAEG